MRKGVSFKFTPDGARARKMSRFAGCTTRGLHQTKSVKLRILPSR